MKLFKITYFIIFLIIVSCSKKNPVEPGLEMDFRISEQTIYLNNKLVQRLSYEYHNDKLIILKTFNANQNDELIEEGRSEFTYEGDKINSKFLFNQSGVWTPTGGFTEYVVQNNHIFEHNYYQDFVLSKQTIYYYDGQNDVPTYFENYDYINGSLKLIKKGLYTEYTENSEVIYSRLDENDLFNEYLKYTYLYLDGQLNEIIYYTKEADTDDNWLKNEKIKYHFSGNELISKDIYQWDDISNNWINSYTDSYLYDSNGLLIEVASSYFDGNMNDVRVVNNYENEEGNWSIFINSGWSSLDETPDPK